ncbi:MAG: exodeoxyribonuclease V subunit gamma, partial [Deltaproteobacteria bacterium]
MDQGLRLYTSNRMENLAEALSRRLEDPLPSPLEQEIIVVQSVGMERWLRMQLARQHGVCANVQFPFPNAFLRDISEKVLKSHPDKAFDPPVMTWRIFDVFGTAINRSGYESVAAYLARKKGDLARYQLAATIADLFDQYLIFRTDMIASWENGNHDHWQALLWSELADTATPRHRATLHRQLIETFDRGKKFPPNMLPHRVSVFGISTLPPFHLQVFSALSKNTEVNLFLLNPCREYWGEIVSKRQKEAYVKKRGKPQGQEKLLHLEEGNSLLASLGTLGRDFFSLVTDLEHQEVHSFEDPQGTTLLQMIQSDILNLRDRTSEIREKEPLC